MKITFLGTHNAESKNSRLVTFLVDDILSVEAGSLTSMLSFAEQKDIRAILLSHGHYDHIRDIPSLAFNNTGNTSRHTPKVVGISQTLQILESHLLDGMIYPAFSESHSYLGKPALDLRPIEPYKRENIEGYQVTALPVNHPIDAVGFEIVSAEGKSLFYTGDTGPGLAHLWQRISPQVLIVDTTFPNRLEKMAKETGHLCPEILKTELSEFYKIKGYLPRTILSHLSPEFEPEIREESKLLAAKLHISIDVPVEGETYIM